MGHAQLVGRNVNRLRTAAGRSLADLAEAGGISKTTLHGIELGTGNPTLSTLYALATALRVPLGALLEPVGPTVEVVRAADGPRVDGDAVHARLLHRIRVAGTIEVYDMSVDHTQQRSAAHLDRTQECIVVVDGSVTTGPADTAVELAAGDSMRFDAAVPHFYEGGPDGGRAVLVMIHPD
ncbi:helix-turn-helix domain-containing protein [Pseudonocardia sp. TRM90224]|uniref:helix-turn-helix domain-containing protein n=1 Tax=Pseudonocardia sp. TRM90224 TaxID=2812678 RepID=UPI001E5E2C40|nr:XRE family transcriptional regulator [Pseudonocardia sp. TRM90224]